MMAQFARQNAKARSSAVAAAAFTRRATGGIVMNDYA